VRHSADVLHLRVCRQVWTRLWWWLCSESRVTTKGAVRERSEMQLGIDCGAAVVDGSEVRYGLRAAQVGAVLNGERGPLCARVGEGEHGGEVRSDRAQALGASGRDKGWGAGGLLRRGA
jgi:hypothetical protein